MVRAVRKPATRKPGLALEAERAGERRVADVKAKFGEEKRLADDEGKAQVWLVCY